MLDNDFDAAVNIHEAARKLLEWIGANELDSSQGARALLLAAATLAKSSGARHKGWHVACEQAWDRVSVFEQWLQRLASKPGLVQRILNLLGLRSDVDRS